MKIAAPQLYDALLTLVRKRLAEQKISQAEIGHALGIKQSAVSYLLKGKTKLSMEQFLLLSDLLDQRPNQLLADADAALNETRPMPPSMEEVLFKSPLHMMAYVAACRPVKAAELVSLAFPMAAVQEAMRDLVRAKIVTQDGDFFIQTEVQVTYLPSTRQGREKRFLAQAEILRICQQVYLKQLENKEYVQGRFNYFMLGYFTDTQIRNIEESLWRAYEKMRAAQRENSASSFLSKKERLTLWQAHLMLMTPTEDK